MDRDCCRNHLDREGSRPFHLSINIQWLTVVRENLKRTGLIILDAIYLDMRAIKEFSEQTEQLPSAGFADNNDIEHSIVCFCPGSKTHPGTYERSVASSHE